MKHILCAMSVAVAIAATAIVGQANAANRYVNSALACSEAMRIPTHEATCLHSSWDNSPASGASSFAAASVCYWDNAVVKAHVDLKNCTDGHFVLDSAEYEYGSSSICDVRKITCCLTASDLCYTNQILPDSRGRIRSITIDGPVVTGTFVDVSTHQKRYNFCSENADDIYCEVDPHGDVNTDPNAECNEDTDPPCNCGDHYCKVEDCTSAYENSQASDSCTNDMFSNHSMSISATNGSSQDCTMDGQCRARIETVNRDPEPPYQRWVWDDVEITTDVENMDDLRNCGGALTTDASCADNNQID